MLKNVVGQPAHLYVGEGEPIKIKKRPIGLSPPEDILRWKGIHPGARCILIANGTSAQEAQLDRIPREGSKRVWTIGLNSAWKLGKWDYNAMGDQRQFQFYEEKHGDDLSDLEPLFTTHASARKAGTRIQGLTSEMKYLSFDALKGFYLNNTITSFGIQLALWMGFTTIFIIGMDAHGRHFYGGPVVPENKFANQRETFGLFAGILRSLRPDVEVINLNLNSHVRVFQKRRFDQVFR